MTNLELDIRARARCDIDSHTEYFEDRDPELAERFHGELEHVFDRLTSFPGFGQPCPTNKYPDLRRVVLPTLPLSVSTARPKPPLKCSAFSIMPATSLEFCPTSRLPAA